MIDGQILGHIDLIFFVNIDQTVKNRHVTQCIFTKPILNTKNQKLCITKWQSQSISTKVQDRNMVEYDDNVSVMVHNI